MARTFAAICLSASLSLASIVHAQQGQDGTCCIVTKVNQTLFVTDYQPGDTLYGEGAAEVSVDGGGSVTDFRLKLRFFNAATVNVGAIDEDLNDVQPGATPAATFWEPFTITSESQMAGNSYDFYATLQYYHESMGLWQDLDSGWARFTTD